ncbi:hypothetical protein CEUSTIGMA_g10044.t1 [Chlamydomonas eustigma]|uniref:Uncharacterized protein n=1 Tax=Chlamydomonas eustigma TaxID=1157962 RepID=A0A250XHR8_9CHLO|nr:hypothetical protein CEUSTIGMA_g10044.t1 [Chlamydomonas eustigma]|eukprot:GAX82618.1 hypothetical protein CEUSTIGMA_g10044.t1 [Chlamydomonas eustigma]
MKTRVPNTLQKRQVWLSVTPRPARRTRTTVMVQASLIQDIGSGIMRIFTPFLQGNKEDWSGTENTGFQGKIDHSKRRPFKDGWTASDAAAAADEPVNKLKMQQQVDLSSSSVALPMMEASKQVHQPGSSLSLPGADDPGVVQGTAVRSNNILPFIAEAAQQVMTHNFTGDATEPAHWKAPDKEKHAAGWSGDIHTRGKDGFHVTKK